MRLLANIAAWAAAATAVLVFLAAPAVKFGLIDFKQAFALYKYAVPFIGVMMVLVVIAIVKGGDMGQKKRAFLLVLALVVAGLAAALPLGMRYMASKVPMIHDITTDAAFPPAIVAGAEAERSNPPEYVGATPLGDGRTVYEAQQAAYPDIQPVTVQGDLQDVIVQARGVVHAMGMEVLAEGPLVQLGKDLQGWRIEAVAQTRWFGFKDDFVVRLVAEGEAVKIDVRSKSRIGRSDLGTNAKRIRHFMEQLEATRNAGA